MVPLSALTSSFRNQTGLRHVLKKTKKCVHTLDVVAHADLTIFTSMSAEWKSTYGAFSISIKKKKKELFYCRKSKIKLVKTLMVFIVICFLPLLQ